MRVKLKLKGLAPREASSNNYVLLYEQKFKQNVYYCLKAVFIKKMTD